MKLSNTILQEITVEEPQVSNTGYKASVATAQHSSQNSTSSSADDIQIIEKPDIKQNFEVWKLFFLQEKLKYKTFFYSPD